MTQSKNESKMEIEQLYYEVYYRAYGMLPDDTPIFITSEDWEKLGVVVTENGG